MKNIELENLLNKLDNEINDYKKNSKLLSLKDSLLIDIQDCIRKLKDLNQD